MRDTVALSIRQPWAYLIVAGIKPVENRIWKTEIRGRVLIHAAKATHTSERDFREAMEWIASNPRIPLTFSEPERDQLLYGGIIGEVEIVDCVEHHESPWFTGPFGFVLKAPKVLPFTPCKGRLGFFNPEVSL